MKEEFAQEIDKDIELQENILKEILENWDEWQSEEYEKEFMAIEPDTNNNNTTNNVFCPICQKFLLQLKENIISCQCGLRLYYPKSLSDFYGKIIQNVKLHEERCLQPLTFFAEPKDGFNVLALNAICATCEFYTPVLEFL